MIILVDSREQRPLTFGCDWKRKKLNFGDYGALFAPDYQYPVVFERKNCADLFGSLTQGYDRLRKCFDRATKANYKMIIAIEGTKEKILKGFPHTQREPESVIKQLETIHRKYGVANIFFPSRTAMAHHIHDYYLVEYENYKRLISSAQIIANGDNHEKL